MAVLEPVHVYELDRATSRLELTRINPTVQYAQVGPSGSGWYTWQNGNWFDTGGNWIENPDDVPAEYRERVAKNPPTVKMTGAPLVTKICQFCGETMNDSLIEQHYVEHVHTTLAQAGAITEKPETPEKPEKPEKRATRG
jgi:hypothetical protein